MAAAALISSPLCCYSAIPGIYPLCKCTTAEASSTTISSSFSADVRVFAATRTTASRKFGTAFASGSPLLIQRPIYQRNTACNSKSVSIRCEQGTKEEGGGLDVWLGRVAMGGFAAGITVEVVTGKGLLENFGLVGPLPTVALAVTALVGVLTAVFIFQSASKN